MDRCVLTMNDKPTSQTVGEGALPAVVLLGGEANAVCGLEPSQPVRRST